MLLYQIKKKNYFKPYMPYRISFSNPLYLTYQNNHIRKAENAVKICLNSNENITLPM